MTKKCPKPPAEYAELAVLSFFFVLFRRQAFFKSKFFFQASRYFQNHARSLSLFRTLTQYRCPYSCLIVLPQLERTHSVFLNDGRRVQKQKGNVINFFALHKVARKVIRRVHRLFQCKLNRLIYTNGPGGLCYQRPLRPRCRTVN